jgi:hypothetical protein
MFEAGITQGALSGGNNVGFFGIVFGFWLLVVLVPVLSNHWYKLRVKQWEMSLKHTMLERGMSAEEIKTVLEASTLDGDKKKGWWSRGPHV